MMPEIAVRHLRPAGHVLRCLGLVLLLVLIGFRSPAADASELPVATAARVAGDELRTRFVADVSSPLGYTAYVLPNPYRVMIDLPQVSFDLPADAGKRSQGLVSEYRFGQIDAGRSRIVLDTTGPVLIEKSFLLPPEAGQPARIVVDIVQTTPEDFAARLTSDAPATLAAMPGATEGPDEGGEAAFDDAATAEPETVAAQPAAKPSRPDGRKLVVIDPGHGGIDPGAIGVGKTKEKDVVLAYALQLQRQLLAIGNIDVVMTRSDDRFLTLRERVRVARDNAADLFIAIHADTVRGEAARGATIYTLSEKASDAEAEALAHKENRSDIIAGVDLGTENEEVTDILIELVQRESKTHSLVFAKKAVAEMKTVTAFTGKPMRSAGFMVLKAPDVPSVLVELGYLSSEEDEKQLTSPAWRERVAKAMARAVQNYFSQQLAAKTP